MTDDSLPHAIIVSKHNTALRHIVMAIRLFRKGFYDCAITLAGAAEGALPDNEHAIHAKIIGAGIPDELRDTDYALLMKKSQRVSFWNAERDWLKHNNPDHSPQMEIRRSTADHMIARAITKMDPQPEDIPESAISELVWYYKMTMRQTDEEFDAAVADYIVGAS